MGWFDQPSKRQHSFEGTRTEKDGSKKGPRHQLWSGRPYLVDVPYIFPKDDEEVRRLDFQHHLVRQILGGNFVSPLTQPPRNILDVGCGTGRWVVEMAQQFHHARVVGLDIELPQIASSESLRERPPNCTFIQSNILEGLPFEEPLFDLVHQRFLYTALPAARWRTVLRDLHRVTRSGGWVELVEGSLVYGGGPGLNAIQQWMLDLARKWEIDLLISSQLDALLYEARFTQVAMHKVDIPMGSAAGRIGLMMQQNILAALESLRGPLLALHVTTERRYNDVLAKIPGEIEEAQGRCVWTFFVARGRRP